MIAPIFLVALVASIQAVPQPAAASTTLLQSGPRALAALTKIDWTCVQPFREQVLALLKQARDDARALKDQIAQMSSDLVACWQSEQDPTKCNVLTVSKFVSYVMTQVIPEAANLVAKAVNLANQIKKACLP